jgi:NADH-quinone oxidoreductase subunit M
VLIALAVILVPIVILASWHDADPVVIAASADGDPPPKRPVRTFFALILVLETMMVGVFAATDFFLFYVFFEAMLIPMYFLIGSYGGVRRAYAAVKFLLYSLVGGLLMLAALIGLYVVSADRLGAGTFDLQALVAAVRDGSLAIDPDIEKLLFGGFFIAFAIKAPLWPFHTWLPDAAGATPGSAVSGRCSTRSARSDAAVLPAALPKRLESTSLRGHRPGGGRDPVRALLAIGRPTSSG